MNRADWIEQSACREYDITGGDDPWHSEGSGRTERARQRVALDFCNGSGDRAACAVKAQCLADALADDNQYGIRGGLTAPQRSRLKAGQPATRALTPCGTRVAYQRHLRNGEPMDQACVDAEAAYQAALRARRALKKAAAS